MRPRQGSQSVAKIVTTVINIFTTWRGFVWWGLENRLIHLQACLVASVVVLTGESSRSRIEEHFGDQAVQANGEDEGDEVEKCNVREEHRNVDCGVAVQFEITFWRLK